MITVIINNTKLKIPSNTTILQACNLLNINIPKFCFHENLQIAGNCRMCLVEVSNSPKPVVSCSTPVMNHMQIFTNTPLVKKARETILEFLLINHPLDCPICDQGGECDLQDQTLVFGSDRGRFFFNKRSVEDKKCGPFIKTIMTRCIHCTKCVRFIQEVCGVDELGTTGRGNHTEISFYLNKVFNSEFSANIIDLCPVGALTSKVYAFKARPWELNENLTIDLFDTLGSTIVVQSINNNIIRILPGVNKVLNLEWINNKTRFFFDSVNYQRITNPMLKKNGKFIKISWEEAFKVITLKLKTIDCSRQNAFLGDFIGLEELIGFKNLMKSSGIKRLNYMAKNKNLQINADIANHFLYPSFFNKLSNSNLCLLLDFNPRTDCSLLNLKLKNLNTTNNLQIYTVGPALNLTYGTHNLGLTSNTLIQILEGKHKFCQQILKAENFSILVGSGLYNSKSLRLLTYFNHHFKNKIQIFTLNSSFLNYLEIIGQQAQEKTKLVNLSFLYNTNIPDKQINKTPSQFLIYLGHHLNSNAQTSDLLLPTLTFLEKQNSYLNLIGNIQRTTRIKKNQTLAKDDLILFSNLIHALKITKRLVVVPFSKLFSYFLTEQIQNIVKKPQTMYPNMGIRLQFTIFKQVGDKFFPRNIFEKNSKILMNSLTQLKKLINF